MEHGYSTYENFFKMKVGITREICIHIDLDYFVRDLREKSIH